MKFVIIAILALAASAGLMFLTYTKEGLKFRKEHGANNIAIGIMVAVIIFFWGLDIFTLLTVENASDTLTYGFVAAIPVLLAFWAVSTRKKTKEEMKNPKKAAPQGRRLR